MPDLPVKEPNVLPFTTGSPGMDSIVRSALIGVSGTVAGACVVWLNKHGYNDPNLNLMISGAVFGVAGTLAGGFWGWFQQHRAKFFVAQQIVQAADTGKAPAAARAVVAKATKP